MKLFKDNLSLFSNIYLLNWSGLKAYKTRNISKLWESVFQQEANKIQK